ncbi:hypothetical protein CEXT_354661 [Caerostris extrusa]|uniref:Uncharacterized protein n=1 Tax=Caerostris extrusa TaxID=172846 RepID=A0AAV4N7P3_CAEEX|nr:hypothetical protein CEXT_354661 [Caerostris extrusa]
MWDQFKITSKSEINYQILLLLLTEIIHIRTFSQHRHVIFVVQKQDNNIVHLFQIPRQTEATPAAFKLRPETRNVGVIGGLLPNTRRTMANNHLLVNYSKRTNRFDEGTRSRFKGLSPVIKCGRFTSILRYANEADVNNKPKRTKKNYFKEMGNLPDGLSKQYIHNFTVFVLRPL